MNIIYTVVGIFLSSLLNTYTFSDPATFLDREGVHHTDEESKIQYLWKNSTYKDIMSYQAFHSAMHHFYRSKVFTKNIIAIADFSKPSSQKRFYIIDLNKNNLLYHTYVSHGKNSGEDETISYSNIPESKKSSLGLYKTAETYIGKHGYSLRLDGLQKGLNDNARDRAIVLHGADYANADFVKTHGRLGRSWGCPAVPNELAEPIIQLLKNGACLFIYDTDLKIQSES